MGDTVPASGSCYADTVRRERRSPVPAVGFRTLSCARSCNLEAGTEARLRGPSDAAAWNHVRGDASSPSNAFPGSKGLRLTICSSLVREMQSISTLAYRTWQDGRRTGGPMGAASLGSPIWSPFRDIDCRLDGRMTVMMDKGRG